MEDITVRRLTKKVFPYLWLRHKLLSSIPSNGIFPFSELTVFSQMIGKSVLVYLHMYRPTLSYYLEKHIPSMARMKMQFWTHVAFLCLQIRLNNDVVFDYFLTTCAITAEVALHCYLNGYDDVLSLASVFFCAFFENELYEGFHKDGGWLGLHRYTQDSSCQELCDMIDGHVKRLDSPKEHLPILILTSHERLAAERREKLMSLQSFKIGEIERDDQTKALVTRIVHWDFMENQRISEVKPGILKRLGNIRHKKNKPKLTADEKKHDESLESDVALDADGNISNVIKLLNHHDEPHLSGSVSTAFETGCSDKDVQTSSEAICTNIREGMMMCTNKETLEQTKLRSPSSLRELRDYYESLSSSSERKVDSSKRFRSNSGTLSELKFKNNGIADRQEILTHSERYPTFVPSSENGEKLPKAKTLTPVTKPTESFHVHDALSEFTKSFQELGFKCLCVGNSTCSDEKSNYAEIMEKCRYFQGKYPSIQFSILIPNKYFTDETSHALEAKNGEIHLETEKDDKTHLETERDGEIHLETQKDGEIHLEKQYSGQQVSSSISKEDLENVTVLSERIQFENEQSRLDASKADENEFWLANEHIQSKNSASENIQKCEDAALERNMVSRGETSKILRFSATKVNENQTISRDYTTEPTIISKCIVSKVDKKHFKDGRTSTIEKNWTNEATKISRFTVTKVNENQLEDTKSVLRKNWTNELTKIDRFTEAKDNENQLKDTKSILKKNLTNETPKISRMTSNKLDDNQLVSRVGTNLSSKSIPTNAIKISRFIVTKIDEVPTRLSEKKLSMSNEQSDDTESETIQFQANGSVKYQKRVSFAEHHSICYYRQYSSDESPNSKTSPESLHQNIPEDSSSLRNSGQDGNQERLPSLRNPTGSDRTSFFRRHSFSDSQSSCSNTGGSTNASSSIGFLGKLFRRSSSRYSKVNESKTEEMVETEKRKIEELVSSLEAEGVENPVVFKI